VEEFDVAKLMSYIKLDKILCSVIGNKDDILNNLIIHTLNNYPDEVIQKAKELLSRKTEIITMNLGNGFAIAHGRMKELQDINIGISILKEPMKIDNKDTIMAVFCILVPPEEGRRYLSLLAQISRLFSPKEAQELFKCSRAEEIVDFVQNFYEGN
jgi:mannitol/fructose-specific phosphotransferase system IIA component (Ntr-type)